MSDRIAVMFEGEIAQVASPQDLYRRPVSRAVASFIGVMNFLPATVRIEADRITGEIAGLGLCDLQKDQFSSGIVAGPAHIGIPPETMTILAADETTTARVANGTVQEVIYYGDMTYYEVLLEGAANNEIGRAHV